MRVFLAIELPSKIKKDLVGIQRELRSQILDVRWEKLENLHLTLVFLGEVSEERIKDLEGAVRKGVERAKPFEVGLSGVRVFPNEKRPRAVLMDVGEGAEEFRRLQKSLEEELSAAEFNFKPGKKPHVTLGRFRRGLGDGVLGLGTSFAEATEGISFEVKEVSIVKSELQPTGAIHTPTARVPL